MSIRYYTYNMGNYSGHKKGAQYYKVSGQAKLIKTHTSHLSCLFRRKQLRGHISTAAYLLLSVLAFWRYYRSA